MQSLHRNLHGGSWPKRLGAGSAIAAIAVFAAGCGSSSGTTSTSSNKGSSIRANFTSVTGKVSSDSTNSLQLTTSSGNALVDYQSTTRESTLLTAAVSDLKTGDCIRVTPTTTSTSSTKKAVTAKAVEILGTTCINQFGGGRGARSGIGAPSGGFPGGESGGSGGEGPPSGGFPGGAESGGQGGPPSGSFGSTTHRFGVAAFGVTGKVTSIKGDAVTVAAETFQPAVAGGTTSEPNGSNTITTSRKVTLTSATTYTTVKTTTGTLTIGKCVTATGTEGTDNVVNAFSLTVFEPTKGDCVAPTTSFAGGFGGGAGSARISNG